jgi:uncharacterized membrane protein (UPF0182 family)
MPQLKKVVLFVGDRLIYTDTYEQALAELSGGARPAGEAVQKAATPPGASGAPPPTGDRRLESIRQHLQRYKELAGQGRWAEAGKELDAIQTELK